MLDTANTASVHESKTECVFSTKDSAIPPNVFALLNGDRPTMNSPVDLSAETTLADFELAAVSRRTVIKKLAK